MYIPGTNTISTVINRLYPATFFCVSQVKIYKSTCHGLFVFNCLWCEVVVFSYWWNRWPSLFKRSSHNYLEWASDYYLTPKMSNFGAISWREQVAFDRMMMITMMSSLY